MKQLRRYLAIVLVCVTFLSLSACTPEEVTSGKPETLRTTVVEIEKYGHAVLDVLTADFIEAGYALGDVVHVCFGAYAWDVPFYDGYYTNPGTAMLRGMTPEENIAVCINYGNLSRETGIAVGDTVEITLVEKAGMLEFQELCALKYSNDRADYTDDITFANFRMVTTGNIADGKLYRTASPINNEHGRASYANDLIAAAEVATVLNLSDSIEDIEEYSIGEDFDSVYYRDLYEAGKIIALDLNANFYSEEFAALVAQGLTFLSQNDTPYAVHCTEGKDRAGFTIMLLSALMGADLEEIIDDYMISFYNYYGIEKEKQPERYAVVLDNNLMAMIYHVTGTNTREELEQIDLAVAVTNYLLKAGMTEADIHTLKTKLG